MMKKSINAFLAVSLIVLMSGCFGSFNLTSNVYEANKSVSENGFVQSAVMVGMFVIPIYEIAAIADILIFNSLEFWTGENPISMEEGEMRRQRVHANGTDYRIDASKDHVSIRDLNSVHDVVYALEYNHEKGVWALED